MSATIVTVSGDKRIQLLNSQLIRRPIYHASWTQMRIGMHFAIPSAASITGTPRLWFGLCSGLTAGIGDATTTNFLGMLTNAVTLTRATITGPPFAAYAATIATRFVKKVGTTVNFNTGDTSASMMVSMQSVVRHAIIIQIVKGSPNWTIQFAYPNNTTLMQTDLSDTQMVALMEMTNMSDAASVVTNYVGGSGFSASSIAFDEVAGAINAINIFWDRTAAPLEISAIYHRKVA